MSTANSVFVCARVFCRWAERAVRLCYAEWRGERAAFRRRYQYKGQCKLPYSVSGLLSLSFSLPLTLYLSLTLFAYGTPRFQLKRCRISPARNAIISLPLALLLFSSHKAADAVFTSSSFFDVKAVTLRNFDWCVLLIFFIQELHIVSVFTIKKMSDCCNIPYITCFHCWKINVNWYIIWFGTIRNKAVWDHLFIHSWALINDHWCNTIVSVYCLTYRPFLFPSISCLMWA